MKWFSGVFIVVISGTVSTIEELQYHEGPSFVVFQPCVTTTDYKYREVMQK